VITLFAAEESTGIASLGLNVQAFLFQLVTFVIIMWLLNKYALSKIFATIEKRRSELEESLANAEKAKQALREADDKVGEILNDARIEAEAIVTSSQKESSELIKQAEEKATAKAERILADNKSKLDQEVAAARTQLKKETVQLVAAATSVVLDKKIDGKENERLIEAAIKETS
jgi:F-type H+-transporting ATPase subunit b